MQRREMGGCPRNAVACWVVGMSFLWSARAQDYQLYGLGYLADYQSTSAEAINDRGVIAGYSPDENLINRAVIWDNVVFTNIGDDVPPEVGYFSSSWGISESGIVVGGGPGPFGDTDYPNALFWDRGDVQIWP